MQRFPAQTAHVTGGLGLCEALGPLTSTKSAKQSVNVQMCLTTLEADMGLTYDEACDLLGKNKDQIQRYGSRLSKSRVGFYVKRWPEDRLGTGRDDIVLVTGAIRRVYDNQFQPKSVLMRYPWSYKCDLVTSVLQHQTARHAMQPLPLRALACRLQWSV